MAIGDGHSGEGATRHVWDADVERVVHRVLNRFPPLSANTYDCHPFCGPRGDRQGWSMRSIDFWGAAGRGDSIGPERRATTTRFLFELPGLPLIRHLISGHRIWLRGVGWYTWPADDHSGRLGHVHVTYLPVPAIG